MNIFKKFQSAIFGINIEDSTIIETDGTIISRGDATVWDDLRGSLLAVRLDYTTGRLNYNWDNNSITMQNDGDPDSIYDRLMFNFQHPHGAVQATDDGSIVGKQWLHIHWEQVSSDKIEWRLDYRIQRNGYDKTEDWTTIYANSEDNSLFIYSGGTLNQITNLGIVDVPYPSLSATVEYRLTRIDTTADDIEATFVDAHIEYDMNGSHLQFVK